MDTKTDRHMVGQADLRIPQKTFVLRGIMKGREKAVCRIKEEERKKLNIFKTKAVTNSDLIPPPAL